jgi:PEP-CTERM motif
VDRLTSFLDEGKPMTFRKYFLTAAVLSFAAPALAAPILWVSDSNGNIAKVDVATGLGTKIAYSGPVLTDIAFNSAGDLFGISFTTLFKINKDTGARTTVGSLGGSSFNALVFGSSGTLYAAGGTSLYSVNTTSGAATSLGSTGFNSAGDLAFFGGKLYLSATGSGSSRLINVGLAPVTGSLVGSTGVNDVFGLARGDDGILYGVAGTSIYTMNVATGAATFKTSYNYDGRGAAFGSAFFAEATTGAVPEPATWAMMIVGFGIAGYSLRRRRVGNAQLA